MNAGKCIGDNVGGTWLVLDGVIITQELGQIILLLWCLDYLRHEILKALMICQNRKWMVEQIMPPFSHCRDDRMQLFDISA